MKSKVRQNSQIGLQEIAGLLHDLKSPLLLIEANLEQLARRWQVSNSDINLNSIRDLIKAAEFNTQSALLVNRIAQGSYKPQIKNLHLNTYVERVLKSFKPLARKFGVKIVCHLDPTLKICQVDPFVVHRILTNLVSNALKFAPSGSEVSINTNRNGNLFELIVIDQGPGISTSQRRKLFKPWSYGKDIIGAESSGMGLFVVKSLASHFGGRVMVQSRPGHGSRFTVSMEGV